MSISLILLLVVTLVRLAIFAFVIYAAVQGVKALRKYNRSGEVRKEKAETRRSLGEVLKEHRVRCKMTQEFVAESLGVSRQAVSKWETGTADPSTSNLLALAKLFGVSAEELLRLGQARAGESQLFPQAQAGHGGHGTGGAGVQPAFGGPFSGDRQGDLPVRAVQRGHECFL